MGLGALAVGIAGWLLPYVSAFGVAMRAWSPTT